MHAEPLRHRADPPLLGEPAAECLEHPGARARREPGEWRQPLAGELVGERGVAAQQQLPDVVAGDNQ